MRLRTAVVTGALALGVVVVPLGSSSPARADEVTVAQAEVDRLQAVVVRTTLTLTEGTRRWEQDQSRLRHVRLSLSNARRRVVLAAAELSADQARVAGLGRRLYMSPAPGSIELAITQRPDEILSALQVQGSLDQVAGGDAELVRRAAVAHRALRGQEAMARTLTAEATDLVARSAARLQELKALAQDTSDQLTKAQGALQRARQIVAARLAAAQAARQAAREARLARATRERLARQRKAASASVRVQVSGGPACTGSSTDGQQNGNLDPASLCPLWGAPGQRLRGDAAAAFNQLSRYHAATVGGPLCVTDSYRSYSEQVALYESKPGLAAVPGTSEHGWGKATDLCGGVEQTGSSASAWMHANAGRFGFFHPSWAEPSGSRPEPWHWEFGG